MLCLPIVALYVVTFLLNLPCKSYSHLEWPSHNYFNRNYLGPECSPLTRVITKQPLIACKILLKPLNQTIGRNMCHNKTGSIELKKRKPYDSIKRSVKLGGFSAQPIIKYFDSLIQSVESTFRQNFQQHITQYTNLTALMPKKNVTLVHLDVQRNFFFVGLLFMIEKKQDYNFKDLKAFLIKTVREANTKLSKLNVTTYLIGFSEFPETRYQPNEKSFRSQAKQTVSQVFDPAIVEPFVTIFGVTWQQTFKNPENWLPWAWDPCSGKTGAWLINDPHANQMLVQSVLAALGSFDDKRCCKGCYKNLTRSHLDELDKTLLDCIANTTRKHYLQNTGASRCFKKVPLKVGIEVCGNGLIEGDEGCDCVQPNKNCQLCWDYDCKETLATLKARKRRISTIIVMMCLIAYCGLLYVVHRPTLAKATHLINRLTGKPKTTCAAAVGPSIRPSGPFPGKFRPRGGKAFQPKFRPIAPGAITTLPPPPPLPPPSPSPPPSGQATTPITIRAILAQDGPRTGIKKLIGKVVGYIKPKPKSAEEIRRRFDLDLNSPAPPTSTAFGYESGPHLSEFADSKVSPSGYVPSNTTPGKMPGQPPP